jgi:hypothetical protein
LVLRRPWAYYGVVRPMGGPGARQKTGGAAG